MPDRLQILPKHCVERQSPFTAQGEPPGSKQVPALHFPLAQSISPTQVAHTLALQRALLHEASSAQASPFLSLQKPAPQLPLKQSTSCVQTSPKCALFCDTMQPPIPSQMAAFVQKLGRSSTPIGSFEHMPTWPGTAQERQVLEQVAAQVGGG